MKKIDYAKLNSQTIDRWVEEGWQWGVPISHEEFCDAKNGNWRAVLTPQIAVPKNWFLPFLKDNKLSGAKLLGLASGGGQQMPVFAAIGADVTVLDYSDKQLESEKMLAKRENYEINIIKADMTKRLPFEDESFDIIFHPVSNCYIKDVFHVWKECFRILKKGGCLLAGFDNSLNYLFDDPFNGPLKVVNKLPFDPLNDKALYEKSLRLDDGIQFSHTLEEQIGGQLKAGFVLKDLYEDKDSEGELAKYCNQYIATRAVK